MAEVLFYHLTQTPLEEALPGLVERSLERQWRVLLNFATVEKHDSFDAHLWTFSNDSFVAHGTAADKYAEQQPVLLTLDGDNRNAADVCFCLEGTNCRTIESFKRVVIMFDGHDEDQVQAARDYWKSLKTADHQLTYWQQSEDKHWEKKA